MVTWYILSLGDRFSARAMWTGPVRLEGPDFTSNMMPSLLRGAPIHSYLNLSAVDTRTFSENVRCDQVLQRKVVIEIVVVCGSGWSKGTDDVTTPGLL